MVKISEEETARREAQRAKQKEALRLQAQRVAEVAARVAAAADDTADGVMDAQQFLLTLASDASLGTMFTLASPGGVLRAWLARAWVVVAEPQAVRALMGRLEDPPEELRTAARWLPLHSLAKAGWPRGTGPAGASPPSVARASPGCR